MSILSAIRRQYLCEQIEVKPDPKKKATESKWLVMFRNDGGKFYLMDSVPPELQRAGERKRYFEKHKIKPAAWLVLEDGILGIENGTADGAMLNAACDFLEDSNNGLGIPYLLAHQFVTEKQMVGLAAAAIATKDLQGDAQAVAAANSQWGSWKSDHQKRAADHMGLPSTVAPTFLAPSDNTPATAEKPMKSADPGLTEEPRQAEPAQAEPEVVDDLANVSKQDLLDEAQQLGISGVGKRSTKSDIAAAIDAHYASEAKVAASSNGHSHKPAVTA